MKNNDGIIQKACRKHSKEWESWRAERRFDMLPDRWTYDRVANNVLAEIKELQQELITEIKKRYPNPVYRERVWLIGDNQE